MVEIVGGMAVDEVNKYFKIWKSFCRNVVEIVGGMAVDEVKLYFKNVMKTSI